MPNMSWLWLALSHGCTALPGVPHTLLEGYPVLKAFRNKIANEPGVKALYEKHGEGLRAAFKPDA